jgi:DNA (cytosine-5)-methyltransferase 1
MVFESRFVRNGRGAPEDIVPPLKAESGEGDSAPLVVTTSGPGRVIVPRYIPTLRCKKCDWEFQDEYGDEIGGLAPYECPRCGEEEELELVPKSVVTAIHPHVVGRAPTAGPQGKEYLDDGSAYTQDGRGVPQLVAVTPINTQLGLRGDTSNSSREGVGIGKDGDPAFTLQSTHAHAIATNTAVRRLTPMECERLQGFPDNYTNIPDAPDGPRYKALGNSMAVPVMRWIGERIELVDKLMQNNKK